MTDLVTFLALLIATPAVDSPAAGSLVVRGAEPAPDLNALFERTSGWIGADGVYSVALKPDRIIWLFSDTWVGQVRDGKRTDATIVNNSLAIQKGLGVKAELEFFVRHDNQKKPTAYITPADDRGWLWLQGTASVNDFVVVFMSQIEKTKDPGVFGFRQIDQSIGIIVNPADHPELWLIEQRKLPFASFGEDRQTTFGAATLVD